MLVIPPLDWVDGVWDLEFTEVEALDAAIEDSVTRNGSQGLEALYRCLLPYTNHSDSSTPTSDGLSQVRRNYTSLEMIFNIILNRGGLPQ